MATGLTQSSGSNITGFSAAVMPDKGFQKKDTARLYQTLPAFIPTPQSAEATLKNDQLKDPNALINYSK